MAGLNDTQSRNPTKDMLYELITASGLLALFIVRVVTVKPNPM